MASALEEFKMQGYDLTGVIASATATDLSKCVRPTVCVELGT